MISEIRWLDSLQGSGIRPGLQRMRVFLRAAGHPERDVPAVIVAGTNGKGSTAATLASIVEAAGYRCGLYSSPHLIELRERWIIGGQNVAPGELRRATAQLRRLAAAVGVKPTYFEALTILAFILFRDLGCELAVLEVGMGGRLDATNVVRPLLALITSVSFDHTEFLGTTLRAIAREKAGVIHAGSIALTSAREPEVLEVIGRRCRERSVSLHIVAKETRIDGVYQTSKRLQFRLHTPSHRYELSSPLLGMHQLDNLALAVRAAEELRANFPVVSRQSIERGVAAVRWRGRLERFDFDGKTVWIDGGHNVEAAERIGQFIDAHLPSPRTLVFGIMKDKEVEKVASILFPRFEELILTRPPSDRAAPTSRLTAAARQFTRSSRRAARPREAIDLALRLAPRTVVVFGSLYLAGEAVRLFDRRARAIPAPRRTSEESTQLAATR